jgi:hypothetical protein
LIAFGRPYITNPDLVACFATNAPLNEEIKSELIYAPGPEGYVDYPDIKQVCGIGRKQHGAGKLNMKLRAGELSFNVSDKNAKWAAEFMREILKP